MENNERNVIFTINVTHNGRIFDHELELHNWRLIFRDQIGTSLDSDQTNAIIETLFVYRDDSDSEWDENDDPLVTHISKFVLLDGSQEITFPDGNLNCRINASSPSQQFFIVSNSLQMHHSNRRKYSN